MKILLISHTRCGSTVLGRWVSKNLGLKFDEIPYNEKTFYNVKEDTLKKIVVEEHFPTEAELKLFDKIICLTRINSFETAVSYIFANEASTWHEKYIISDYWLKSRADKINKWAIRFEKLKNSVRGYMELQVEYENIYENTSDIEILKNYLNIKRIDFDYMLSSENRYRERRKNNLI